jgi:hypothetical protein
MIECNAPVKYVYIPYNPEFLDVIHLSKNIKECPSKTLVVQIFYQSCNWISSSPHYFQALAPLSGSVAKRNQGIQSLDFALVASVNNHVLFLKTSRSQ